MTEPTTIKVVDKEGVQYWASRRAPFIVDGLADGSLREVPDAALPTQGAHLDPGTTDGPTGSGPSDGQRGAGDPGGGGDESVDGAETGSGTRKRR